jgi:UDP-glucuronate decarboxylase
MSRYLVTGGAGFLGSHLCDSLIADNHEVIALDNFFTGSKKNLDHLYGNHNFEIIRQDVTQPLNIEVDGIFNLACPASPVHYQKFPTQTLKTNVYGAINVLDLSNRLEVPVLQASTSEVYGDPQYSPQNESYWGNVNPVGIRSCYDEGKRAAETLFTDYHRQYGVSIRIARIFNTYGPRMSFHDGRVVSNFIYQALKGLPISVFGDGSQIRSLCYVSDLIDGLRKLFEAPVDGTPVNIGNPSPITMLDLAMEVIELTNSKSQIEFMPLPSDDPLQREPDIEKAKRLLAWSPSVARREGLLNTIQDFSKRM